MINAVKDKKNYLKNCFAKKKNAIFAPLKKDYKLKL